LEVNVGENSAINADATVIANNAKTLDSRLFMLHTGALIVTNSGGFPAEERKMSDIHVLHGPNLNLLGSREPAVYGIDTLDDINHRLMTTAEEAEVTCECLQSNSEAELIDAIHHAQVVGCRFIIINPAALTHTSVALRDALLAVAIPFIEVHLSNVYARESFRQHSYFSDIAVAVVCGLKSFGYDCALAAALDYIDP